MELVHAEPADPARDVGIVRLSDSSAVQRQSVAAAHADRLQQDGQTIRILRVRNRREAYR
jgi:hypothetical protein